jgi:DNA repair protein RecO (recombination protein O)
MIHTTQGIVLHSFKYGDSGIIARILTPGLGLQSYLVQGARKSKSRIRASLFQPLTLLDMVVYHKEKSGLQRIREARCSHPFHTLTTDIRKTTLAIFICEMLINAFKHQEPQKEAFDFIFHAVQKLDMEEDNLAIFHMVFLLQLSKFLGFSPGKNYTDLKCFFNLKEGIYQSQYDNAILCLTREESNYFYKLSVTNLQDTSKLDIPAAMRKILLQKTIDFYRYHMEGFKEIKSHHILESVFH